MSTQPSRNSRIQGAILGAFVGDALGVGPHWYYDLKELKETYGEWIDNYTTPQEGRYHSGLNAGDSSQAGIILALTLESIIANQGYDSEEFCQNLDTILFPQLNGDPMYGPGCFTSQSMRDTWQARQEGQEWGCIASLADNTEAAERIIALAAFYANSPRALAIYASANTALTQSDPTVGAMTVAYALVLGQLINGEPLDAKLSGKLMELSEQGELPFHNNGGNFASPDALLTVSSIAQAVQDEGILIEPAWKVSLLYGLPCAVYHQLPAVYHLAARFQGDFESAVLHAINGGGQNLSRAMLTGALCGAIGGLEAIPQRFLEGLTEHDRYLKLAQQISELAAS